MFHCPSETVPCLRSPKVSNKGETSRDESSNIYLRALKHSQVGILGQEAWLGLWRPGIQRLSWWRFQRATFQRLQNEQDIEIFLTGYLIVWTLQIYKEPKVQKYCGAHIEVKTMVLWGKGSAPKENTNYIGKCNTRNRKVWTKWGQ